MTNPLLDLLDSNRDGCVDHSELKRYLLALLRSRRNARDDDAREAIDDDDEKRTANDITERILSQTASKQEITIDEFQHFMESDEEFAELMSHAQNIAADAGEWMTIPEMSRLTSLYAYNSEELYDKFAAKANAATGEVSREAFREVVHSILRRARAPPVGEDVLKAEIAIDRLFDCLDSDHSGAIDMRELAAGVMVLAGGDADDKVRAAFALYDTDGNGVIDPEEMRTYLTNVYKLQFETDPRPFDTLGITPEELARLTAEQVFLDADSDGNGELSFEEFKQWYSSTNNNNNDDELPQETTEDETQPPPPPPVPPSRPFPSLTSSSAPPPQQASADNNSEEIDERINYHDFDGMGMDVDPREESLVEADSSFSSEIPTTVVMFEDWCAICVRSSEGHTTWQERYVVVSPGAGVLAFQDEIAAGFWRRSAAEARSPASNNASPPPPGALPLCSLLTLKAIERLFQNGETSPSAEPSRTKSVSEATGGEYNLTFRLVMTSSSSPRAQGATQDLELAFRDEAQASNAESAILGAAALCHYLRACHRAGDLPPDDSILRAAMRNPPLDHLVMEGRTIKGEDEAWALSVLLRHSPKVLRELSLRNVGLAPEHLTHLASGLDGKRLLSLDLTGCGGGVGAFLTSAARSLAALESLALRNANMLDDDAGELAHVLATTRAGSSLRHLRLALNPGVSSEGWCAVLLSLSRASGLETLDLSRNQGVDDEVMGALRSVLPALISLKRLDLSSCALRDLSGVSRALVEAPEVSTRLVALDLSHNEGTERGAAVRFMKEVEHHLAPGALLISEGESEPGRGTGGSLVRVRPSRVTLVFKGALSAPNDRIEATVSRVVQRRVRCVESRSREGSGAELVVEIEGDDEGGGVARRLAANSQRLAILRVTEVRLEEQPTTSLAFLDDAASKRPLMGGGRAPVSAATLRATLIATFMNRRLLRGKRRGRNDYDDDLEEEDENSEADDEHRNLSRLRREVGEALSTSLFSRSPLLEEALDFVVAYASRSPREFHEVKNAFRARLGLALLLPVRQEYDDDDDDDATIRSPSLINDHHAGAIVTTKTRDVDDDDDDDAWLARDHRVRSAAVRGDWGELISLSRELVRRPGSGRLGRLISLALRLAASPFTAREVEVEEEEEEGGEGVARLRDGAAQTAQNSDSFNDSNVQRTPLELLLSYPRLSARADAAVRLRVGRGMRPYPLTTPQLSTSSTPKSSESFSLVAGTIARIVAKCLGRLDEATSVSGEMIAHAFNEAIGMGECLCENSMCVPILTLAMDTSLAMGDPHGALPELLMHLGSEICTVPSVRSATLFLLALRVLKPFMEFQTRVWAGRVVARLACLTFDETTVTSRVRSARDALEEEYPINAAWAVSPSSRLEYFRMCFNAPVSLRAEADEITVKLCDGTAVALYGVRPFSTMRSLLRRVDEKLVARFFSSDLDREAHDRPREEMDEMTDEIEEERYRGFSFVLTRRGGHGVDDIPVSWSDDPAWLLHRFLRFNKGKVELCLKLLVAPPFPLLCEGPPPGGDSLRLHLVFHQELESLKNVHVALDSRTSAHVGYLAAIAFSLAADVKTRGEITPEEFREGCARVVSLRTVTDPNAFFEAVDGAREALLATSSSPATLRSLFVSEARELKVNGVTSVFSRVEPLAMRLNGVLIPPDRLPRRAALCLGEATGVSLRSAEGERIGARIWSCAEDAAFLSEVRFVGGHETLQIAATRPRNGDYVRLRFPDGMSAAGARQIMSRLIISRLAFGATKPIALSGGVRLRERRALFPVPPLRSVIYSRLSPEWEAEADASIRDAAGGSPPPSSERALAVTRVGILVERLGLRRETEISTAFHYAKRRGGSAWAMLDRETTSIREDPAANDEDDDGAKETTNDSLDNDAGIPPPPSHPPPPLHAPPV